MATVTRAIITCDLCGNANDVQTWAFGFDGKQYEIDLCPQDADGLSKVADGYRANARKVTIRPGQRHNSHRRPSPREPRSGRSRAQKAKPAPKHAAKASGMQQKKRIYVYGILPADIEVAAGVPGVGEDPGPLGVIRSDGLAALISELGVSGRLGSPEDVRAHREILDSTAIEVPVLPLRFGTVLAGEAAVTDELLTPRHDEFAAALEQLDGCAEFLVKGRYVRAEPGEISNETVTAERKEDTRALRQAMEGVCVASVVKEPAHEMDAVHVAFLVALDEEDEVERVIEDLAREWEGRIEVQLLGPMAAYDFVRGDGE